MDGVRIGPLEDVNELTDLLAESEADGHRFVRRLVEEQATGKNRFDAPGEVLLGAWGPALIGVCGLNRDPYLRDTSIGRLRHLYVARAWRRQGVGRALVQEVIARASGPFRLLVLRTQGAEAAAFYAALGFAVVGSLPAATHVLSLEAE